MDIARFMRAHLQTGQAGVVRILAEQTAREMHRQHFTQHPRLPGFCYGFWESFNNGRRAIQHGGSVQGYDVYLFLLPTEQVGLFVAQNGGIGELSGPFIDEFMDRFFPGHFTPPAVFPTQSPTPLESLAGWYRVTQRPLRTLDKLALLLRPHDVRVSVRPDGVLDVRTAYDGDGRVWLDGLSFVEVGPLHFRDSTGRYQMAFRTGTRGPASHLFTDAARHPVVFDSIAWYDRREIHWSVLIGCSIVFLSAGFRRSKGAEHRPSILSAKIRGSQLERAWLCAKVTSALNLIFAAAFPPYLLFGPIRLGYGEMGAVPLLLAVPVIATVLTVPLVLFAVQAWRADYWSVLARVHYTIVTLAALAFVWFLGYWNLLGLRY